MDEFASHFELLREDASRTEGGFSPDMNQILESTQNPSAGDDNSIIRFLDSWISKYQPCLFGRVAAKKGLLHYCILREEDLLTSDEAVKGKIQSARLSWKRRAIVGDASAFIIAVISRKLALAVPDSSVLAIAKRLASLYLFEEIDTDRIYADRGQRQ